MPDLAKKSIKDQIQELIPSIPNFDFEFDVASKTEKLCSFRTSRTKLFPSKSLEKHFETFDLIPSESEIILYTHSPFVIKSSTNKSYETSEFCVTVENEVLVAEVCKETKYYIQ